MIRRSCSLVFGRDGGIHPQANGCAPVPLSRVDPNELVSQVHTRMPVILPVEHHRVWLGETENGDLKELLKPYPSEEMKMWPISERVNSPKNNDPSLLEPIS
jgi:putative SOS response-associated peptidase YedK